MSLLTETVGVAEAKRRFSDLLGRVAYGQARITIARRGKPMAHLVPAAGSTEGLASVKGWLSSGDPFLRKMSSVLKGRKRFMPRAVSLSR